MGLGSRRSIGALLRCAVIVVATLASVPAAGSETVLRWASAGGALTFDPHGHDIAPTQAIQNQVYEALTRVNNDVVLEPVLATAWKLVGPTTWKFTLRQDVRFHDGAPLTADDVVFSLDRARAETSELADWRENTAKVEPAGDHTVRITTASPDLLLPVNLSRFTIMSRAWAEHHDTAVPSRPNDPQQGYAAFHANGTGPFRLAEFEPGGRIVMLRNPDWWGSGSHPVAIDRIEHDTIADANQRLAALLAGRIDLLVTVDAKPLNDHLAKVLNRKTDLYMLGWTQQTYDSYIYLRDWYHSAGGNRYNATGYANPRVDELISAIDAEMVTYARDALIEETWQMVLSDVVLLPLHHQVIVWAMRDELQLPMDPNAVPWFRIARFGEPG